VPPELSDITEVADSLILPTDQYIGISIALVGALIIAVGTQLQHTGVTVVGRRAEFGTKAGLGVKQLMSLFARPSWLLGTILLGVAMVFQLISLGFAPLIVVQPVGAIALVATAIMNSRITKLKLDRTSIRAIIMCVGGVGLFVTIAAATAKSSPITELQLSVVLIILSAVLIAFAVLFALLRKRFKAIFYIVGAGVLFGFVATLAKVVIDRIKTLTIGQARLSDADWLTLLCVVGLLVAALLGAYFVQSAYSNGPPDLVVAGLTVIDPLVAITVGILVLGEASAAPLWAIIAYVIAGATAIYGVLLLAKNHPQSQH